MNVVEVAAVRFMAYVLNNPWIVSRRWLQRWHFGLPSADTLSCIADISTVKSFVFYDVAPAPAGLLQHYLQGSAHAKVFVFSHVARARAVILGFEPGSPKQAIVLRIREDVALASLVLRV